MKSLTTVLFLIIYILVPFIAGLQQFDYDAPCCDFLVFIFHNIVEFFGPVGLSKLEIFCNSFFKYFSIPPPAATFCLDV